MKTYVIKLINYEVKEIRIKKNNKLDVLSYLYDMKIEEEKIVSIEEVDEEDT